MENVIFCALDPKGIPREPARSPQGVHREPPGSTQGGPRESPGSSQGVSREAPGRPRGGPREAPRKRQGGLREAPGRCTKYGLHHRFLRFLRFGNRCSRSTLPGALRENLRNLRNLWCMPYFAQWAHGRHPGLGAPRMACTIDSSDFTTVECTKCGMHQRFQRFLRVGRRFLGPTP